MNEKPYGCYNREPFKPLVTVQDGYYEARDGFGNPVRSPKYREIPFRNRADCSYTHTELGQADPRCAGCSWRVQA